ncbi:FKBP-type peptidyl-prolyl cis-trans isomerase [Nocardioides sp. CN2-186]|uniref:FKBP-type peptidyl-prolyl cis-trans isomerase n=1 Tax=Nocardioides tweenelious TaxID=3156607 RepID=UPI0032B6083E
MSRRLRRLPILLLPLVMMTALSACGSDDGSSSDGSSSSSSASTDDLHGISITGDVGKEPTVTWDGKLDVDKTETSVVTAGDGDTVAEGDQVNAHLWIGNGTTQKKAYSTYDAGKPETVTASDQLAPVFKDAILGQKIGSRVAVTTTAADAFGESGNPQLGIGNQDTVLIIVDIIDQYTPPKPKDVPSSQLPSLKIEKGDPVGFDFSGIDEPKADGDLLRSVIKEGTGETVTTDMTIKADYLGAVYGAKKPFDESYSKDPVEFALTDVVQGWTYGLSGLKVGSRVILQIPPSLGYGDQAQTNIPAGSTLYFVVDIVSAK